MTSGQFQTAWHLTQFGLLATPSKASSAVLLFAQLPGPKARSSSAPKKNLLYPKSVHGFVWSKVNELRLLGVFPKTNTLRVLVFYKKRFNIENSFVMIFKTCQFFPKALLPRRSDQLFLTANQGTWLDPKWLKTWLLRKSLLFLLSYQQRSQTAGLGIPFI